MRPGLVGLEVPWVPCRHRKPTRPSLEGLEVPWVPCRHRKPTRPNLEGLWDLYSQYIQSRFHQEDPRNQCSQWSHWVLRVLEVPLHQSTPYNQSSPLNQWGQWDLEYSTQVPARLEHLEDQRGPERPADQEQSRQVLSHLEGLEDQQGPERPVAQEQSKRVLQGLCNLYNQIHFDHLFRHVRLFLQDLEPSNRPLQVLEVLERWTLGRYDPWVP